MGEGSMSKHDDLSGHDTPHIGKEQAYNFYNAMLEELDLAF